MGRRIKKLPCVYCVDGFGTEDHIFARGFFLEADRENLPKAPACKTCNLGKSKLESYATAVLPFISRQEFAPEILLANKKRLDGNHRLGEKLSREHGMAVVATSPFDFEMRSTLPVDFEQIAALFGMISKALIWYHWGEIVPQDRMLDAIAIHSSELDTHLENFSLPSDTIQHSVGRGTFSYTGIRAVDAPFTSIWRYKLFGGGEFGLSQNSVPDNEILVVCGRDEFIWKLLSLKRE